MSNESKLIIKRDHHLISYHHHNSSIPTRITYTHSIRLIVLLLLILLLLPTTLIMSRTTNNSKKAGNNADDADDNPQLVDPLSLTTSSSSSSPATAPTRTQSVGASAVSYDEVVRQLAEARAELARSKINVGTPLMQGGNNEQKDENLDNEIVMVNASGADSRNNENITINSNTASNSEDNVMAVMMKEINELKNWKQNVLSGKIATTTTTTPQQQQVATSSPPIALQSNSSSSSSTNSPPITLSGEWSKYAPSKLERSKVGKPGVLDKWQYELKMYQMMRGISISNVSDWTRMATVHMDQSMGIWLASIMKGKEFKDWEEINKIISQSFLPVTSEAMAFKELMALQQGNTQSLSEYLAKAQELMLLIGERRIEGAREETIVESLLAKMDSNRYFHSHRTLSDWFEGQVEKKLPIFLSEFMIKAQKCELSEKPSDIKSSENHSRSRHVSKITTTKTNTNNNTSASSSSSSSTGGGDQGTDAAGYVAAVKLLKEKYGIASSAKVCLKCGETGHITFKCKSSTELRTCYNCGNKGHLAPNCTSEKKSKNA